MKKQSPSYSYFFFSFFVNCLAMRAEQVLQCEPRGGLSSQSRPARGPARVLTRCRAASRLPPAKPRSVALRKNKLKYELPKTLPFPAWA